MIRKHREAGNWKCPICSNWIEYGVRHRPRYYQNNHLLKCPSQIKTAIKDQQEETEAE